MGLARLLVPRRKENAFNALLLIFCCFLIYYYYYVVAPRHIAEREAEELLEDPYKHGSLRRGIRYDRPNLAKAPNGPGEKGAAVTLTGVEKELGQKDMKTWFMNVRASDKISLDRTIPDARRDECKAIDYDLKNLPKASVVIIFTDEAWSPLLRTVHSVVNRSPPEILEEVILLDDNSQREELKGQLDDYIRIFDGIVRIVRKNVRHGLIRAKLAGAREAVGDVVIFLDSHCEANTGWLEPLVQRIHDNPKAIVCPVIDHINAENMAYQGDKYATSVGGFSWALHFTWEPLPQSEIERRKSTTEYIRSPTMAGGLLAADRKYFFEVGGYDEEMDIWGGENLEISFRVWMCGGSIEFIPCSHVGHIFRAGHPYNMTGRGGNKDVHGTNSKRLAEVWMDNYKRLYYLHRPDLIDKDVGPLNDRIELRDRLGCKSFKWYLDNIIPGKFIMDEDVQAYGTLHTFVGGYRMCSDTLQRNEKSNFYLGVFPCQGKGSSPQIMSLARTGELRRETVCATASDVNTLRTRGKILMTKCHENVDKWTFEYSMIKHVKTGLCISTRDLKAGDDIFLATCDSGDQHQFWRFTSPK
ncbi:unnamed protein product [Auanema sp. JU1783]|nr:unnamed protein product [Auanema sp. JU1783]